VYSKACFIIIKALGAGRVHPAVVSPPPKPLVLAGPLGGAWRIVFAASSNAL